MCGIAGLFAAEEVRREGLERVAADMVNVLAHRGPDDVGTWADPAAGITFGHRRLSIIDLSPAGHQPMLSHSGRLALVLNGEIYNHLDLRTELESAAAARGSAIAWRGRSDTETLLVAFEQWGVDATLSRVRGMFALALWDAESRMLSLARDRFGEKPLYYGWVRSPFGQAFAFGSELKALRALPEFDNAVCRDALALYMRFLYVPAPRSIYAHIFKLEPGCVLRIQGRPPARAPDHPVAPGFSHGALSVDRWWSLADVITAAKDQPFATEQQATNALESSLSEAIRLQSFADVTVGAFLSGGVDSSTIVALMQAQSIRPVKTFTIGFENPAFDESVHAAAVARHLGTDHSALFVREDDARHAIPKLPAMYDEPFADSSQIATYFVCRAARQHATVALSGDGGDELFGGYNRYLWAPRIWSRARWLPFPLRQGLSAAITAVPPRQWDLVGQRARFLGLRPPAVARLGEKAHKLATRLHGAQSLDDLYRQLVSEWQDPGAVVRGSTGHPWQDFQGRLPTRGATDSQSRMMYVDSISYLPDDILCKVDRAAMAVSLETRVPFLDPGVVEVAWRMPPSMKIRNNQGKWALRQVLYKYVPRDLIERPKSGFSVPLAEWLRGPLRTWANSLLDEKRLASEGYFHHGPIRAKWAQHLDGSHDHSASLWAVLMFGSWLEQNGR